MPVSRLFPMAAPLVSSLLVQAPPGEQPQVAASLRTLLADGAAVVDEQLAAAAEEHNLAQYWLVELEGGGKAPLCPDGRLPDGSFLEPRSGTALSFDHVARCVTASRPATADELAPAEAEELRRAVQSAAESFVREVYSPHGGVR